MDDEKFESIIKELSQVIHYSDMKEFILRDVEQIKKLQTYFPLFEITKLFYKLPAIDKNIETLWDSYKEQREIFDVIKDKLYAIAKALSDKVKQRAVVMTLLKEAELNGFELLEKGEIDEQAT